MAHWTHSAVQLPNYTRGVRRLLCYCRSAELDRGRHGRKCPGSVKRKTTHAANLIGTSSYQIFQLAIHSWLFIPWGLVRVSWGSAMKAHFPRGDWRDIYK